MAAGVVTAAVAVAACVGGRGTVICGFLLFRCSVLRIAFNRPTPKAFARRLRSISVKFFRSRIPLKAKWEARGNNLLFRAMSRTPIAPTGRAMPPETELVDMRFADPIKRTNGEMWRQYRVI